MKLLTLTLPAAILGALLGCSGLASDRDEAKADLDTGSEDPVSKDTGGESFPEEDAWWGIVGTVGVLTGQLDQGAAQLTLSARADGVSCTVEAGLVSAVASETGSREATVAWWDLVVEPARGDGCTWPGPSVFGLGFGPPDPQLRPAAERSGLSLDSSYSLYLDAGTFLLIGLAGTDTQLAGGAAAPLEAPLADGSYRLDTLYGVPLGSP